MTKELVLREYMDGTADHYNGVTFQQLSGLANDMAEGTETVTTLSKKLGVNRKTMYKILDKLYTERR